MPPATRCVGHSAHSSSLVLVSAATEQVQWKTASQAHSIELPVLKDRSQPEAHRSEVACFSVEANSAGKESILYLFVKH